MEGRAWESSLEKCSADMGENLKALWSIWVPAQLVNFSVVPVHLRVPFGERCLAAWRAAGCSGG